MSKTVKKQIKKQSQNKRKASVETIPAVLSDQKRSLFIKEVFFFIMGMVCMALIGYGLYLGKQSDNCEHRQPVCCVMPEVDRYAYYITAEYKPYFKKGTHQIVGRVHLEETTGVRFLEVLANPVTTYSREWFARNWAGHENLKEADKRVWRTHFAGKIKPDGSFVLSDLPEGDYFVGVRACVMFNPNQKCREVRFGRRVNTSAEMPVELPLVSRIGVLGKGVF